jgi:hypothetical protein
MYSNNINKLPDAYYKGQDGNNYKLLNLNELAAQTFSQDTTDVLNSLDLEQATGATLDLYGQLLDQERGSLNDNQYRILLKNKIGENICQGDYNSVLNLLAQIFECNVNDITFEEVSTNKINITKLSLTVLSEAGFTGEQAIEMVERLLPACVRVNEANIEGTFEFGSVATDYDENKGFGNVEQSIGGYFGLLVTNDIDIPL